jgi:hypothetical protein
MRLIAQNLYERLSLEKGMGCNHIMSQANNDAAQAIAEFDLALAGVRSMLVQQQVWLADENKRLAHLRREHVAA